MIQQTTIVSALQGPVKRHEQTLDAEVKAKFGTRCKHKMPGRQCRYKGRAEINNPHIHMC